MRLLVIRNSALGDVTLLHSCFAAMKKLYPEAEIIFLTKAPFQQLFLDLENVHCITGDYKNKHKGLTGLLRLAGEIHRTQQADMVLDMHDVLRSKIIRSYFKTKGLPVFVINKNRKAKADLISGKNKRPLPHVVELYADVFKKAGFDLSPELKAAPVQLHTRPAGGVLSIGIAPFAKHALKTWPAGYMKELMKLIHSRYPVRFYLFGGKENIPGLEELTAGFTNTTMVAGKYPFEKELDIMKTMQVFISMDSANMHLADLAGTRVFSIWGATDPLAGFSAWHQPSENSVSIPVNELPCRPCTIYGKGECYRKDLACLTWLTPERVFAEMEQKGAFI